MAVRQHPSAENTACVSARPGDPAAAKKQAQGLTLVPYWGHNEQGQRIACCAWIKLRPGESISEAAGRLSRAARQVRE